MNRFGRLAWILLVAVLAAFPFAASRFHLDVANQIFLAAIGALGLMLLTGYAGQISLGSAGLLAAGAYTVGVLYQECGATVWITIPASAVAGAILGLIFGLPSLRLRGIYLAVSTLALHYIVIYFGNEYETAVGYSSGVVIDPPSVAGYTIASGRTWYFILLSATVLAFWISSNLLRSKIGRAWRAIRVNETVAEALGIPVARYKLIAFVISSAMTAVAGALFGYYRGFVGADAFSILVAVQYAAMVIIGGMGSLVGAVLGAIFVTVLPYLIEYGLFLLPVGKDVETTLFAINYAAFGLATMLFLLLEPGGLVGLGGRIVSGLSALQDSGAKKETGP
jgi:branched-chain amino acid transport system permease protein